MATDYQTAHIATKYETKDGQTKTRYTRVGALFFNAARSGEAFSTLKLDFPVGVIELVFFAPKADDDPPLVE